MADKWLSDEELEDIQPETKHRNCQACLDEQIVFDQAREANRLRAGANALMAELEPFGGFPDEYPSQEIPASFVVDRLCKLLEGEK